MTFHVYRIPSQPPGFGYIVCEKPLDFSKNKIRNSKRVYSPELWSGQAPSIEHAIEKAQKVEALIDAKKNTVDVDVRQ